MAQWQRPLYLFALGLVKDGQVAQDVVQVAFARLLECQERLDSRGRKAWLYKVVYHEALDQLRRRERRQRALRQRALHFPTQEISPEQMAIRAETVAQVRQALADLPEAQRQVVLMRIYENKTFATIAQELGVPLGTVLSRMHAAVKKLRRGLRDLAPLSSNTRSQR